MYVYLCIPKTIIAIVPTIFFYVRIAVIQIN